MQRRYRTKLGEVDIIAIDKSCLVFVEVKTRRNALIDPVFSIDLAKQKKIKASAQYYMLKHKANLQPRFDVVCVYYDKGNKLLRAEHFYNYF